MGGALDAVTETRETYDVIARAYLERKRDRPWDDDLLDLLDRFCARVAPGARVADVGCGHGLEVEALLDRGLTALGVDASDYAPEAGRDTIWLLASRPHRCQAACPL